MRRILGAAALVAAALLILFLEVNLASRWWRAAAFPLVWGGLLGLLEARSSTCVVRAAQAVCELDDGRLSAMDPGRAALLSAKAKRLIRLSAIAAAAITFAALAVP
jgi:hypothetical protein